VRVCAMEIKASVRWLFSGHLKMPKNTLILLSSGSLCYPTGRLQRSSVQSFCWRGGGLLSFFIIFFLLPFGSSDFAAEGL